MPSIASILTVLVVLSASFYQLWLKPSMDFLGISKRGKIVDVGAAAVPGKCYAVGASEDPSDPEGILSACEKIVLHQETGLLYLACSTLKSRGSWTPAVERLSPIGRSSEDYLATYDPRTKKITKLNFDKYYAYPAHGFSAHGMDVVPSQYDKNELFIYAINHRLPKGPDGEALDPEVVGADSAVDMFKTRVGSDSVEYLATFVDPTTMICPNDVVGRSDGKGFWFTNDHSTRIGLKRKLHLPIFGVADTSVGYCHIENGCKFAAEGLRMVNGITANVQNGTFYVGNAVGKVLVMEVENEDELVKTGEVDLGMPLDNLSMDSEGHVWVAGLPEAFDLITKQFSDPNVRVGSTAFQITENTGSGSFYGDRYTVNKILENNGSITSSVTTVVHDAERKLLFLSGVMSPWLTVCDLS